MNDKVVLAFTIYMVILLVACNNKPNPIIVKDESACWIFVPISSIYSYDDNSGVCFYPNGKCFRYLNRYDQKIPYGTWLDIQSMEDIFRDWRYYNDSLMVHTRRYMVKAITKDSLILSSKNENILLVRDTANTIVNWGLKKDSIPEIYLH